MPKAALICLIVLVSAAFAGGSASAESNGTAAEAKAMLDRAIVEVKAGLPAALAKFNDANGGYRDRDLYVFCANADDGVITAHPKLVGTDLHTLKDKNGKPFGVEMLEKAREGEVSEVAYMWPRPDGTEPVEKSSYITKVSGQLCGVGYYK